jgi:hypothetical protein
MLQMIISRGRPAGGTSAREHRRVLPRAIIVEPRRSATRFAQHALSALRQRFGGPARKIAFLEPQIAQHPLGDRHVFRLPAMGRAGERDLVGTPAKLIQMTRSHERHELERLCARAPVRFELRIPGVADESVVCDDRGGHVMDRLRRAPARDDYIDIIGSGRTHPLKYLDRSLGVAFWVLLDVGENLVQVLDGLDHLVVEGRVAE